MELKHLERLYGKKFLENQKEILNRMKVKKELPFLLASEDEGSLLYRIHFDKYLELAFRHGIVDDNLRKRLKSSDWKVFLQTHQELMCAYFFEKVLKFTIQFYPKGEGDSIGDFSATLPKSESIFVEIKSPIRKRPKGAWRGDDRDVIKKNVKRAREQMGINEDGFNLVVLSGELKAPFTGPNSGMIAALYGEQYFSFPVGPAIEEFEFSENFKPNGLFQPNSSTRISAVATLKDALLYSFDSGFEFQYNFCVYHNLYTKKPLDRTIFGQHPQFVFNEKLDTMEWFIHDS